MSVCEVPQTSRPLYVPRGAAFDLIHYQGPEVLLSGPAGTGKSIACLWKMHFCASNVPGLRGLIVRKTRESLTESALVTFEEKILPPGELLTDGLQRRMRQAYHYPNGSEIVLAGLNKPSKVMSAEYDLVYVQEAVELSENDWESLTTRLRNGVLPYQQILADCNPDAPGHWLKKRCDSGRTVMLESRHEDNPTVTPEYLAKLDALTGARLHRLRYGRWVQAEGVVYEGFDAAVHVIDRFPIPAAWPRYWCIDFGYTNPFVWAEWAVDGDGRLYLVQEIYLSQTLVEDHAQRIKELTTHSPKPVAVICDHDAEGRATLERHLGVRTWPAFKAIRDGIQMVAARLRKAGDGKPRIYFLRDSLDRRDPVMVGANKPTCTVSEFDSYVWDTGNNRKHGEEPLDKDNHGMDQSRYVCAHLDRPRRVAGAR